MTQEQELRDYVKQCVENVIDPHSMAFGSDDVRDAVDDIMSYIAADRTQAADMIESLLRQLNEAKNQLDSETFTRERREARCRELHAQLEKAREVKPLEWGGKQEAPRLTAPGYHISAKSELGVYRIDYFEAGHVKGGPFLVTTPDGRTIRNIERIDDAKSLAQADYQRRYNAMSQEGE